MLNNADNFFLFLYGSDITIYFPISINSLKVVTSLCFYILKNHYGSVKVAKHFDKLSNGGEAEPKIKVDLDITSKKQCPDQHKGKTESESSLRLEASELLHIQ